MDQGRRTCKKCKRDFWLTMFREYAPGKHRHNCRECENARQVEYQRTYEQRKREKVVAKAAGVKVEALEAMQRDIDTLKKQVERLTLALEQADAYKTTNS